VSARQSHERVLFENILIRILKKLKPAWTLTKKKLWLYSSEFFLFFEIVAKFMFIFNSASARQSISEFRFFFILQSSDFFILSNCDWRWQMRKFLKSWCAPSKKLPNEWKFIRYELKKLRLEPAELRNERREKKYYQFMIIFIRCVAQASPFSIE
jgi:hypothetical protein